MGSSNSTVFAIIGVAIIAAMLVAMLVVQTRHRNQAATRERLQQLNTQYRRINSILRNLPPAYLSVEVRDFLYRMLIQNLKTQSGLSPEQKKMLGSEIEQLTQEREQVRKHPPRGDGTISLDGEETKRNRQILKTLHGYVKQHFEAGHLSRLDAEKMLMQLELKLVETALDYFKGRGVDARKHQRYREARVAVQKAIDTITTSRHGQQFKQEEIELRTLLDTIITGWRQHRVEQSSGQSQKLAEEMENMIEDEDSWKKKNVYD